MKDERNPIAHREQIYIISPMDKNDEPEEALFNAGVCYYQIGEYDKAFKFLNDAAKLGISGETLYYIASIYAKIGLDELALRVCNSVDTFYQKGLTFSSNSLHLMKELRSSLQNNVKRVSAYGYTDKFHSAREAAIKIITSYYGMDASLLPLQCLSLDNEYERITIDGEDISELGHQIFRCMLTIPGSSVRKHRFLAYIYDGHKWHDEELDLTSLKKDIETHAKNHEVMNLVAPHLSAGKLVMYAIGETHGVMLICLKEGYKSIVKPANKFELHMLEPGE